MGGVAHRPGRHPAFTSEPEEAEEKDAPVIDPNGPPRNDPSSFWRNVWFAIAAFFIASALFALYYIIKDVLLN